MLPEKIGKPATTASLSLSAEENEILRLTTVLQSGFIDTGKEGDTIFSFLMTLAGFTESYILNEVQTIFYNGDALDDLESELAGKSATVALGSAMPGLAGAIMKKGSPCGSFRKTRTILEVEHAGEPVEVRVKLFNTVARERGPQLFAAGLKIDVKDLVQFLELRPRLIEAFKTILVDEKKVASPDLIEALSLYDQIIVKAGS